MKILVLVKHVPDSLASIRIKPDGSGIDPSGVKFGANPFDEFAVEQAVRIREGGLAAEIVAVCLGPDAASETLRAALAMGADRGVLVADPAVEGQDSLATARCLAAVVAAEGSVDLVLAGEHAIDDGQSLVPSMLAELLHWPQANGVTALEVTGAGPLRIKAARRIEGGEEIVELISPAVVTCEKGLNEPRYPSLPNLMKAKKKEIRKLTAAALNVAASQIGVQGSGARVVKYFVAARERKRRKLAGTPQEQATELVRLLRDEAGVI
ncbi:MAG: electron transfer flavoprotein subunit beta/FixA family protein [Phycisphaerae bacterium]|nr:electron transfer flavoprotein subunit beta/FixA family protein [Phycisphaerae bacterium]